MGLKEGLKGWGDDLLSMFFPALCEVCGRPLVKGEEVICTACNLDMPRCNFHTDPFNTIHQRLAGHAPIERAAGYFYYYRGDMFTQPVLAAKYKNRPNALRVLARNFAEEISADGFFDGIDLIVPVPMHWRKRMSRGYNQTDYLALGLSEATGIAVGHNLKAVRSHSTQTRKGAFERWRNSLDTYEVVGVESLAGKHLLVVDDVITTGATMLACCKALHRALPHATLSVLALGVTNLQ